MTTVDRLNDFEGDTAGVHLDGSGADPPDGPDPVGVYLREIGRVPLLGIDAERRMVLALRRCRSRWRRALLRDLEAIEALLRRVAEARRGRGDIGELLDSSARATDPAVRNLIREAVSELDRLRMRACLYSRRLEAEPRGSPQRSRIAWRAGRARVAMARFAATLPLGEELTAAMIGRLRKPCSAGEHGCRVGLVVDSARREEEALKQQIVESNLRLVVAIAKGYARGGAVLLDLVQAGNIGLLRAADRFEPARGVRFGAYAAHWVRQAIVDELVRSRRPVFVPDRVRQVQTATNRARRTLFHQLGREASADEVAAVCGLARDVVLDATAAGSPVLTLDAPAGAGSATVGDLVEDRTTAPVDDELASREQQMIARNLLGVLSAREQFVVRRRFGFDSGGVGMTLELIGDELGVTRERVRQIEAGALAKIRREVVCSDGRCTAGGKRDEGV